MWSCKECNAPLCTMTKPRKSESCFSLFHKQKSLCIRERKELEVSESQMMSMSGASNSNDDSDSSFTSVLSNISISSNESRFSNKSSSVECRFDSVNEMPNKDSICKECPSDDKSEKNHCECFCGKEHSKSVFCIKCVSCNEWWNTIRSRIRLRKHDSIEELNWFCPDCSKSRLLNKKHK